MFKIFKSCQLHTKHLKSNMLQGFDDNSQYKTTESVFSYVNFFLFQLCYKSEQNRFFLKKCSIETGELISPSCGGNQSDNRATFIEGRQSALQTRSH